MQQILQQHHLVQPLERMREYPNIIIVMEESFGTLII